MKYLILLGDGMSDYPDRNGQTPLSLAAKPFMDKLAARGEMGLAQTVPDGLPAGSDVANLSCMGFDPEKYYSGRSPLEAASIGVELFKGDMTYRLNLVTLTAEENFLDKTMLDYSAGEIDTPSAAKLIGLLKPILPQNYELFAGVSYRHCLVKRGGAAARAVFTPPHDITDKKIAAYLPTGDEADVLLDFMQKANALLERSPDNTTKANAAWIWGAGTKPDLPDFEKTFGVKGAVISAVDLIKGIGVCAGMTVIDVAGATGTLKTAWDNKAAAALDALKTHDFVFLHIEAADECGHQGDKDGKIQAIELFDQKIVGKIYTRLTDLGEPFRLLIMPDHATPLCTKTHARDSVPYLLYDSENNLKSGAAAYTEAAAKETGITEPKGYLLIKKLLAERE